MLIADANWTKKRFKISGWHVYSFREVLLAFVTLCQDNFAYNFLMEPVPGSWVLSGSGWPRRSALSLHAASYAADCDGCQTSQLLLVLLRSKWWWWRWRQCWQRSARSAFAALLHPLTAHEQVRDNTHQYELKLLRRVTWLKSGSLSPSILGSSFSSSGSDPLILNSGTGSVVSIYTWTKYREERDQ